MSILPRIIYVFAVGLFFLTLGCEQNREILLQGAGATFPGPVYRAWALSYPKPHDVKIHYDAVGSGQGINSIEKFAVDFGASDKPLRVDELEQNQLFQIPMLIGGVVPIVNLPGIGNNDLLLTGEVLAAIYLGEISRWNDPLITRLNSNLNLPDRPIRVVHRQDDSGTSWIFTGYLSAVSNKWTEGPGHKSQPQWPTGIGVNKNSGVIRSVVEKPGSIGYVQYAFVADSTVTCVRLANRQGQDVSPSMSSFYAALKSQWEQQTNMIHLNLVNASGKESWPMTNFTYLLIPRSFHDHEKAHALLRYLTWCYDEGSDIALGLNYIPVPSPVADDSIKSLRQYLLKH